MVDDFFPRKTDPRGCGLLKPFGTMAWYNRDTLKYVRPEKDENRVACGGVAISIKEVKLCNLCATKVGARW